MTGIYGGGSEAYWGEVPLLATAGIKLVGCQGTPWPGSDSTLGCGCPYLLRQKKGSAQTGFLPVYANSDPICSLQAVQMKGYAPVLCRWMEGWAALDQTST